MKRRIKQHARSLDEVFGRVEADIARVVAEIQRGSRLRPSKRRRAAANNAPAA